MLKNSRNNSSQVLLHLDIEITLLFPVSVPELGAGMVRSVSDGGLWAKLRSSCANMTRSQTQVDLEQSQNQT